MESEIEVPLQFKDLDTDDFNVPALQKNDDAMIKTGAESRVIPQLFAIFKNYDGIDNSKDFNVIVRVLCNVASYCEKYDKAVIYNEFLPQFSYLFNHPKPFVREQAVETIPSLADLFGPRFTEKFLIPHLLNLAEDCAECVREACLQTFPEVSNTCSKDLRTRLTSPFVVLLSQISIKHPKAVKELSYFIFTFADSKKTGLTMRDGKIVKLNRKKRSLPKSESGALSSNDSSSSDSGTGSEHENDDSLLDQPIDDLYDEAPPV